MEERVRRVIDEYVRPLIEADGGSVELIEATESAVVVRLGGTCAGCPGRPYTLRGVVEPAIRHALGRDLEIRTEP